MLGAALGARFAREKSWLGLEATPVPRQNSGSTELHPFNNVTGCAQAVDSKVGHHFGEGQGFPFAIPTSI
jgi:hypothetical protein